ncbi:hypothetical protein BaRGS_00016297 [Batillaria attramentaria]|uniref:Ig-like domain-containing protein n=1 Tax=Batillaria attramentaria TaxID=370345 RepID=A0ABD0KZ33_9CAEN
MSVVDPATLLSPAGLLNVELDMGRDWASGQHRGTATSSKVASVGGQQVLECELSYPGNQQMPYMVQWRKDGIKDPILIKYDGYSAQVMLHNTITGHQPPPWTPQDMAQKNNSVQIGYCEVGPTNATRLRVQTETSVNHAQYRNRLALVNPGVSLQISYIRVEDEGWYECDLSFMPASQHEVQANNTWIYLTVHCESHAPYPQLSVSGLVLFCFALVRVRVCF